MTRMSRSRAAVATGLTLGTATLSLAFAPAALAAELPAPVAPATVAAGASFTVSGAGCEVTDAEYGAYVLLVSDVEGLAGDIEVNADGTWTAALAFPAGTPAGAHLLWAACDNDYYADAADYPEVSVNVTAMGTPRGVAANTPGTVNKDSDRTSVAGEKIVRVIAGFQPREEVKLVLNSDPVVLGTFTADAQGVVTAEFTLPAGTALGEHTLVFDGNMGTHYEETITVTSATPVQAASSDSLAYTGASVALPLALGTGLLALGGGALVVSRRRSAGATQA